MDARYVDGRLVGIGVTLNACLRSAEVILSAWQALSLDRSFPLIF